MQLQPNLEIGVDIGGTFTDVVCQRPGHSTRIFKLPTTSHDPSVAVIDSLKVILESSDTEPREISRFVHGTTIATNAVIERKGAKIGLLTTKGFKDVLEIGRMIRESMYQLIL
ncbi:MAG: hydantoinase/oxoprolinase family protein, partial [Gammaproteobacteria bacterium]|nr:hydantoinase/oxoprolinase family protein [Gammaproteobacteria bacterium]